MNYDLIFNNKRLKELGISIVKRPNIPIPDKNINLIELEGRDGSLVEDLETYKDIEINIECNFIDLRNTNNKAREISYWINESSDKKLFFSDDMDHYFKVLMVKVSDIQRQLRVKGTFTLTFICQPFRYLVDNDLITITSTSNIYSPELTYDSRPLIKIYGSGDVTFTVNGSNIILKSITSHIILNSEIQEAYSDTFENLNNKMLGEFPVLKNGINSISWVGTVTKVEITPNWRCL